MDQPSISNIGFRYGIYTALVLVVYALSLQLADYGNNTWFGMLSFVILAVAIIIAHRGYKDAGDGYLSYGQGLGLGTFMSALSGVFTETSVYIYLKIIDIEAMELLREETRISMDRAWQTNWSTRAWPF